MRKRHQTGTRSGRNSTGLAAAALREAARIGSMAQTFDPENTAEMKDVLSALLAAEETVQDLARRFMQTRAS